MSPAQNQNNSQKNIPHDVQIQPQPSTVQKPITPSGATPVVGSPAGVSKERESVEVASPEVVREISKEVEVSKELEKVGVRKIAGEVELPPDVKKLGAAPAGPSIPVAQATTLTTVVLPISDKKVVQGLHEPVINALRWLTIWCIRKLKKAHVALKIIHGKIVRVKIK